MPELRKGTSELRKNTKVPRKGIQELQRLGFLEEKGSLEL
jgi:hypothetical protein